MKQHLLLVFILLLLAELKAQKIYTINTVEDVNDGMCDTRHCSLREAILAANADIYFNILRFQLDDSSDQVIRLGRALPPVSGSGIIIEGFSFPGDSFSGKKLILDGQHLVANGLVLDAPDIRIFGLTFQNFTQNALFLNNPTMDTLRRVEIGRKGAGNIFLNNKQVLNAKNVSRLIFRANYVGTTPDFSSGGGNIMGILVNNDWSSLKNAEIFIGGDRTDGVSNYFVNCLDFALKLSYHGMAKIEGNIFGTGPTGEEKLGNKTGINCDNWRGRIDIGGSSRTRNVFAYNDHAVIINRNNYATVSENSFYCNDLALSVIENNYPSPVIETGTDFLLTGTSQPGDFVEVYITDELTCNSEDCQGMVFLGTTRANNLGIWELPGSYILGHEMVALSRNDGRQSMFSDCFKYCPNNLQTFSPGDTILCQNESVRLNALTNATDFQWLNDPVSGSIEYSWKGPEDQSFTGETLLDVNLPGRYIVQASIMGCPAQPDTTFVDEIQVEVLLPESRPHCMEEQFHLVSKVNSNASEILYQWTGPGNFTSTEPSPDDASESGTYQLIVTADGCSTDPEKVTIHNYFPEPIQMDSLTGVCEGSVLSVKVPGYEYYRWSADFSLPCTNCEGFELTPPTSGTLKLFAGPDPSCLLSAETKVILNYPKSTQEELSLCSGNSLNIFGAEVTLPGIYSRTFTGANGCDSIHNILVVPEREKKVVETRTICAGESIEIAGEVYASSGMYPQSYIASNGCDSIHVIDLIVLPQSVALESYTICSGESVTIFGEDQTIPGTYSSVFSDRNGCDSTVSVNLKVHKTFEQTNYFDLCQGDTLLLFQDFKVYEGGVYEKVFPTSDGCDSLIRSVVNLNKTVESFSATTICAEEAVILFESESSFPQHIKETFPASNGCDSIHVIEYLVLAPKEKTEYITLCPLDTFRLGDEIILNSGSYTRVFISQDGCDSVYTVHLQYSSPMEPDLVTIPSCAGQSNGSLEWTDKGGIAPYTLIVEDSSGSIQDNLNTLNAGLFTVIIRDSVGCVQTTQIEVGYLPQPEYEKEVLDLSCFESDDGAIFLIDEEDYEYSLNDALFSSQSSFDNLKSGTYKLSVKNKDGCGTEEIIKINQPNPIRVQLPGEVKVDLGKGILLDPLVSGEGSLVYEWETTASLSCFDCQNPLASPVLDTKYTLRVYDENNCEGSAQTLVRVVINKGIYLPNVFSPNGDGLNDYFTLYAPDGPIFEVETFKVFDRWGTLLFESFGFPPNEDHFGWNGRFKGKTMDPGVYIYYAVVRFVDGTETTLRGDITLTD